MTIHEKQVTSGTGYKHASESRTAKMEKIIQGSFVNQVDMIIAALKYKCEVSHSQKPWRFVEKNYHILLPF